jgi:hypothetical protein
VARSAQCFALGAALLLNGAWAAPAHAQQRSGGKAAAEALFEQGKSLYEGGQYEQACAKFAASQELDAGFGTLMNLGECYEKRGMTASAWATFKEAAGLAHAQGQSDREAVARDRASILEGHLARLVVHASDEVASLPGVDIRLNGTSLPRAVWGTPVPVDPGLQRLVLTAPGYRAFARDLTVADASETARVDVEHLEREASQAEATPRLTPAASLSAAPAASPSSAPALPPHRGDPQRSIGFVTGGVGLAAMVVGSIFGARAISKNSDSKSGCRTETLCSPGGLSLRHDALDAARVSTVAFIAGGVLTVTGLTLVLIAPRARDAAAPRAGGLRGSTARCELGSVLGTDRAGLELRGAW